jgi:hypothetical protein
MIAFVRGELRGSARAGRPATVRIGADVREVAVPVDPGPLDAQAAVLVARTRISVGITTVDQIVLLGRWEADRLLDPRGLNGSPVVVLPDRSTVAVTLAGLRRAGRRPAVGVEQADEPAIGPRMLRAMEDGAEALVIAGGGREELWVARALGGRPLAALPLDDPGAMRSLFAGLDVDVQVPVPTGDDVHRAAVRSLLGPLELETMHHLVEVDPRPALEELGDLASDSLAALAAAAAGVLAGRIVVGDRRWRAEAEA